ncbi:MAG: pentapeptide repeat-containing protein [Planctomycetota bacterium]
MHLSPLLMMTMLTLIFADHSFAEPDQPSPEDIRAYMQKCVYDDVAADLIAEFGTDYRGLDLTGMNFGGTRRENHPTNLEGADFSDAILRNARFGAAILSHASFRGADLTDAQFVRADLRSTEFTQATLNDAHFLACDFCDADFRGASLENTIMNQGKYARANFSDVDLSVVETQFRGHDMTAAVSHRTDLTGKSFVGARLVSADLTDAILRDAHFSRADLTDANLDGADLTGITVIGASLSGVTGLDDEALTALQAATIAPEMTPEQTREMKRSIARSFLSRYGFVVFVGVFNIAVLIVQLFRRTHRVWKWVLLSVNTAMLWPPWMLARLLIGGGHSTRQLGGDSDSWSAWIDQWSLSVLLCAVTAATLVVYVIWLSVTLCKRRHSQHTHYLTFAAGLTLLHLICLLMMLFANVPTA